MSTKGEDKTRETPSQASGTLCVAPLVGASVHDYLGGEQAGSLPLHWLDLGKMLGPRRPCPSPGEGNWPILNSGEHCTVYFFFNPYGNSAEVGSTLILQMWKLTPSEEK